jgi:asparagine synthase (glutamine-hydrolysing)
LVQAPGTSATLYQGIHRLRSSQLVRVGPEGEEYEQIPVSGFPVAASNDIREIADQLLNLIEASIARSIGSSKKIGVFVGGLDSSGILAAVIARSRGASDKEVRAITLHFAGPYDDRQCVRDICRALQIEPVRIKPAECAVHLLRPAAGIDAMPLVTPQWPWNIQMSRWAAENGIEVLLSGEGGDHLFDGDTSVFADDLLSGHWLRALRGAAAVKGFPYLRSMRERMSDLLVRPAIRRAAPRIFHMIRAARNRRRLAKDFRWAGPALRPWIRRKLEGYSESNGVIAASDQFLDHRDVVQQFRLLTGCRFEDPYLDDDLVHFVDSLPKALLFHGGYRRGLFRFAFRHLLPDSVRLREDKSGFQNALGEIFEAGDGPKLVATHANMRHLADLEFIEPTAFRIRLEQLVRNPREGRQWLTTWPALAIEAFLSHQNGEPLGTEAGKVLT